MLFHSLHQEKGVVSKHEIKEIEEITARDGLLACSVKRAPARKERAVYVPKLPLQEGG